MVATYATNKNADALEHKAAVAIKERSARNNATEMMIARLDQLIRTLRVKKIPTNVLQAVCSLYLNREHMVSAGELAEKIGVSGAAITNVVDGMERHGFALRVINTDDRRSTFIRLTDRGAAFAEWVGSCLGFVA